MLNGFICVVDAHFIDKIEEKKTWTQVPMGYPRNASWMCTKFDIYVFINKLSGKVQIWIQNKNSSKRQVKQTIKQIILTKQTPITAEIKHQSLLKLNTNHCWNKTPITAEIKHCSEQTKPNIELKLYSK
jgi:hypothetical protein